MKIAENIVDKNLLFNKVIKKLSKNIHVALPAIITEIDYEKQTCKAQAVIREFINNKYVDIPEFMDVPFFILSGGDYAITMPIKKDDECLIVFADSCIDSWWQSGGIQNPIEIRNHDLSDCFALVGFRSQDKKLEDVSNDSLQIRNKNNVLAEFKEDSVKIQTDENVIISIDSNNEITIKADSIKLDSDNITIAGINFKSHTHTTGQAGTPTGGVITS
ncbi:hypothetical protein IJJ97_03640 [bacterium]|nr:hypothetical protein [bacterium]